ncbi:MAG: ester cyclase [Polyangiaceae bacterium]
MMNVFGRLGAVACLGMLAAACGGGDAAAPPPAPPPAPVAAVDTTPAPTASAAPTPAKPTLAELQATAIKTIADAMNAHDSAKYASVFTDDVSDNMMGMPSTSTKADAQKNIQMAFDQYKDMKFWVTRTFTKNDMVATEFGWSGTDTGGFMGKPATEKQAGTMGLTVAWFTPDGLIKKEDRYMDFGTVAAQLGMSKMKARAVPTASTSPIEAHVAKGTPAEDAANGFATTMYTAMDSKKEADFLATIDDNGDFVDNAGPMAGVVTKKADAKKFFAMWTKAFPDAKTTITNSFGVEDFVIVESTMNGTQKGALGPMKASNKPVSLHSAEIYQIANGKMIHGWSYSNGGELMMQIGMMKHDDKAADQGKAAGASKGAAAKPAAKPATK